MINEYPTILTYFLDDVIMALHCTSQIFTSWSYFLTLNILRFEFSFEDKKPEIKL